MLDHDYDPHDGDEEGGLLLLEAVQNKEEGKGGICVMLRLVLGTVLYVCTYLL